MENTIEIRWYGSLVMSLEDMGGPLCIYSGTNDIVEACEIAMQYEKDSHGCLETESYTLWLEGVRIEDEAIGDAFEQKFGPWEG